MPKIVKICSVFPCTTPVCFNDLCQPKIKTITTRMQPNYNKKTKTKQWKKKH